MRISHPRAPKMAPDAVAGDSVRIPELTSETFVRWLLGDFVPGGSEARVAASLNTILAARKLEVVAKPSVEV